MQKSTNICYPLLLISSIGKKSFTTLGRVIRKSGDTVRRLLNPAEITFKLLECIAIYLFRNKKELIVSIDDTLIKKFFSKSIEGTDLFFDTKTNGMVMSYKCLIAAISDTKYTIPLRCTFLPSKDMMENAAEFKEDVTKKIILEIQKIFPEKNLIFTADGAFTTKKLIKWAIDNAIKTEMRIHSNRVVQYKGQSIQIRYIKDLIPKGRHRARTIQAIWHHCAVEITADRRIDKHGQESIVYLIATYHASPAKHVAVYKRRWPLEKVIRTTKQYLGLQECFSTLLDTQLKHVASVLLAYAFAQLERKKQQFDTPEDAIKWLKKQNFNFLKHRFSSLNHIFGDIHA
jgi:hypothetical protein